MARPTLINPASCDYTKFGNLADLIQTILDEYVFEDGVQLMHDTTRDEFFAKLLRKKMGTKLSRFEAFTFQRGLADGDLVNKHVDGPNDFRPGYRTTAVFCFYTVYKGNVYRNSFICYTRKSIGRYMDSNMRAQALRQVLRDYLIEHNGFINYYQLSLKTDMSQQFNVCRQPGFSDNHHATFRFIPNEKLLTEFFFERNPSSFWKSKRKVI